MSDHRPLDVVILGLSITSSWGNGHATTYRALTRALHRRGHRVRFLERDVPWYAGARDMPRADFCEIELYSDLRQLRRHAAAVRDADLVILGSYVPDGIEVGEWILDVAHGVTGFYDIDTPVTLARLRDGGCGYVSPELIPGFDLYLSFTGGPMLKLLQGAYGARQARPLYCSVDPELYRPDPGERRIWDLGYMGTYSDDRQPGLERLLLEPARRHAEGRYLVVGSKYPYDVEWPDNVRRIDHLPPVQHALFYNSQRFTLNLTRSAMTRAGWSPSVRLFEAAACSTPVISDRWPGIDAFFQPGREILLADSPDQVLEMVRGTSDEERRRIGERARRRVLSAHTSEHRAAELEGFVAEARAVRTAVA